SLKSLRIVVMMSRDGLAHRLRDFTLCCIPSFLGTITIRIWIIPVRVVIIRRAGVDRVEYYPEDSRLYAGQQVARSSKRHFGSFAATDHEQHTVGLHGEDHGIGGRHDRR